VGISSYNPEQTRQAAAILGDLGTPCLIHQPRYNMFDRWVEDGLLETLEEEGIGCIGFSPLCQGILTDKYLEEIPEDSRANKIEGDLHWGDQVSKERLERVAELNKLAQARGQSMAQMAIAWVLRHPTMTSALIGASKVEHIEEAVAALENLDFGDAELEQIEAILA
jgi:L-glyceraldehyde 3-phosphate reductase